MDGMKEFNSAAAAANLQVTPAIQARRMVLPFATPVVLEDGQGEHGEPTAWLTDYKQAVSLCVSRNSLLAFFDAMLERVKKHVHSIETSFEQAAWPHLQQRHLIHRQITSREGCGRTHRAAAHGKEYTP